MSVTVIADNVDQAADQLGVRRHRSGINITWRRGDSYDFHTQHEVGCIVDATDIQGEEVKLCFTSSADALRYIGALLKKHDDYAREQKKQRAQEEAKRKAAQPTRRKTDRK